MNRYSPLIWQEKTLATCSRWRRSTERQWGMSRISTRTLALSKKNKARKVTWLGCMALIESWLDCPLRTRRLQTSMWGYVCFAQYFHTIDGQSLTPSRRCDARARQLNCRSFAQLMIQKCLRIHLRAFTCPKQLPSPQNWLS